MTAQEAPEELYVNSSSDARLRTIAALITAKPAMALAGFVLAAYAALALLIPGATTSVPAATTALLVGLATAIAGNWLANLGLRKLWADWRSTPGPHEPTRPDRESFWQVWSGGTPNVTMNLSRDSGLARYVCAPLTVAAVLVMVALTPTLQGEVTIASLVAYCGAVGVAGGIIAVTRAAQVWARKRSREQLAGELAYGLLWISFLLGAAGIAWSQDPSAETALNALVYGSLTLLLMGLYKAFSAAGSI